MGPTKKMDLKQGEVIDIGGSSMYNNVGERLAAALKVECTSDVKPTLPDELLYTDVGLPIWNDIIFTPEFYQTHDEIALFDIHGSELVKRCPPNVTIIDLGAGDTRKVEHLLAAFEKARQPATYMALDISRASLEHNVRYLADIHSRPESVVTCVGLWGTFEDGMRFVQSVEPPRLFLSLGSVLCNDEWATAVSHLKYWADTLRVEDLLLVGMDAHLKPKNEEKIWAAYHSRDDLYKSFFLNGFEKANKLLGENWFREEDWDFLAELESEPTTRHRFFFKAKRDIHIAKVDRTFYAGDEIDWFDSHKYGEMQVDTMCNKAKLTVMEVWQAPQSEFRKCLLTLHIDDDGEKGPASNPRRVSANLWGAPGQYVLRARDAKEKADADSAVSGVN